MRSSPGVRRHGRGRWRRRWRAQKTQRHPPSCDHAGHGRRIDCRSRPRPVAQGIGQTVARAACRVHVCIRPDPHPRHDGRGAGTGYLRDLLMDLSRRSRDAAKADLRTEAVRRFYERAPFPGYAARDSLHALRLRAERNLFVRLLDRAIPGDARIVEIGCGTGQMALYLARADRLVVAVDFARSSLQLGAEAARRFGVHTVRFVQNDLRQPGLRGASFDVVYSSGVLHHTPRPRESFARIAALARPGGVILVGVYNRIARLPTRLRRAVARLTRFRVVPFDPVLRDRRHDAARRDAWLRDQYRHPEEHSHSVREIGTWFDENGVE